MLTTITRKNPYYGIVSRYNKIIDTKDNIKSTLELLSNWEIEYKKPFEIEIEECYKELTKVNKRMENIDSLLMKKSILNTTKATIKLSIVNYLVTKLYNRVAYLDFRYKLQFNNN